MRRFIILILFIVVGCIQIYADEYIIYKGSAYKYNFLLKRFTDTQFLIKYSDEEKVYYLFSSDYISKQWINITSEQLDSIRKTIEKYFDWVKIATDNQVEIDKTIPDSEINTSISWMYGDDWHSNDSFQLYFAVLSQDIKTHQLIISSNKVNSRTNQFISAKLETLYLNTDEAAALLNGIQQDNIMEVGKEYQKKKSNQDLFK